MTQFVFANNAQSSLSGSISNTSTVLSVQAGAGALFPNPGAGQQFELSLTDAATGLLHEIVYVTAKVGDTFTIVRGQEGTTALNWSANDPVAELWTKGQCEAMVQGAQAQSQSYNYGVDTGSVNAYVIGLLPAVTVAPTVGMPVRVKVKAGNTNTGACTLDCGWGPSAIVRRDGSACIGNEVVGSEINQFFWDPVLAEFIKIEMAPATSAAIAGGVDQQSAVTPAQLSGVSFAPSGSVIWTAALAAPAGWVFAYGQSLSRTTDAALFAAITKSNTVTISIATPAIINWPAHGLAIGSQVSFETTGTLPTGLSIATNYFVNPIDANNFHVSTSIANAFNNVFIATSGSQTGVQTCRFNPFGCGDGLTTFQLPDLRDVTIAGSDIMPGSGARGLLGSNTSVGGFLTAALGNMAGEQAHTQTVPELVSHHHSYLSAQPASTQPTQGGGAAPASMSTGDTGGGLPFNVTQPTLLLNGMIKL